MFVGPEDTNCWRNRIERKCEADTIDLDEIESLLKQDQPLWEALIAEIRRLRVRIYELEQEEQP